MTVVFPWLGFGNAYGGHLYCWPEGPPDHKMVSMIEALGEAWSRRKPLQKWRRFHYNHVSRTLMALRPATESYQSMPESIPGKYVQLKEPRRASRSTKEKPEGHQPKGTVEQTGCHKTVILLLRARCCVPAWQLSGKALPDN